MTNMEALRFSFIDRTLDLTRMPIPEIEDPNDVLVKVAFAGICGTDLHVLAGEYPCRQSTAITLGHEIAGTVVEVGNNVLNFVEGDKVAVDPNRGCKRCVFCHAGKPQFCKAGCDSNTIGIYKDGGWAQFVLIPEEQLYKLPETLGLDQGVFGEALSCIVHGWELLNPISVGEKFLILGAGITGTLWASVLHLQGQRNAVISDPLLSRLELLRKLNTNYILVTPEQLRKYAYSEPEMWKFDVIIDCCGDTAAIEQGFSLLNPGGKLVLYSVMPPTNKMSLSPYEIFKKEIKIIGVNANPYTFNKSLNLIAALGSRYLNHTVLGVKLFQLNEYKEAIENLKRGTIIKAMFQM